MQIHELKCPPDTGQRTGKAGQSVGIGKDAEDGGGAGLDGCAGGSQNGRGPGGGHQHAAAIGGPSGQSVAASISASLTGTASTSSTVVLHQIRASVTEDPSVEDESVVVEFAPLTLSTTYGLTVPGAKAHFRLVGITADGHESGSDWVTIERPV